ncbi:hypothetical protein [Ruania alba]|uniref:RAMA domain-containing protein n=1 Tax=Ruania alba TaxID=648782 RepID=A0A1H5MR37_9MICO|nr:hypothetical protein [Ruania alba]SEE91845.1 hypothetical protein SAMN04488554_3579 [Ruania alba]
MPSFAFDSGLLVPTVLGRRTSTPLTPELRHALRDYLLDVIGVDLFPVAWSDGADPVLTALDPAGQVVTAVVTDAIDGVGLVRALARAGETSASSWLDIAARYPGGVAAFRTAWARFREARPVGAQPGPQLFVVAGSVDPEVLAATRVMHGVRVYSVDLRPGADGQQVVDVSPVHTATVRVLDHVVHESEELALTPETSPISAGETAVIAPVVTEREDTAGAESEHAAPSQAESPSEAQPEVEPDLHLQAVADLVGAPMPIEVHTGGQTRVASLSADGRVVLDGARYPTLEEPTERIGLDPGRAWLVWQMAGFPMADARDEAARAAGPPAAQEGGSSSRGESRRARRHAQRHTSSAHHP